MITILTTPQKFMPVYNDIAFVVDSDVKTWCSMRYVCKVYISGILVVTLKLFPNATNGTATFRINKVLENYVNEHRHNNVSDIEPNAPSVCLYECVFGEEIGATSACDPPFGIVDSITSEEYHAWHAVLQYPEFPSYNWLDFMPRRNQTTKSAELAYNGQMWFTDGGWPAYTLDGSGNAFGLYLSVLRYTSGTAGGYGAQVDTSSAPVSTRLRHNVSYHIEFDLVSTLTGAMTMDLGGNFASWPGITLNITPGTVHKAVNVTCGTASGLITILIGNPAGAGDITIDNLTIKENATETGIWQPSRLLTNQPAQVSIHRGEEAFISWLQYAHAVGAPGKDYHYEASHVEFKAYDSSGSVVWGPEYMAVPAADVIDIAAAQYSQVHKFMLTAAVGPKNIVEYFTYQLPSTVDYYEVVLVQRHTLAPNSVNQTQYSYDRVSEVKRYNYFDTETRFKTHRLEWIGRLGNMDSFSFRLRDTRTVSSDPQEYTQIIPQYTADGSPVAHRFGYELGQRGRTVYNNNVTEKLTVLSEYMSESEAAWLEELFTSASVLEQTPARVLCVATTTTGLTSTNICFTGCGCDDITGLDEGMELAVTATDINGDTETEVHAINGSPGTGCVSVSGAFGLTNADVNLVQVVGSTDVLPVVITSRDWKARDKRGGKDKNISYTIDYERAYPIVVQRG